MRGGRGGVGFREASPRADEPVPRKRADLFLSPGNLEGRKKTRLKTFRAKVLFPEVFKDLAQQKEEEEEEEEEQEEGWGGGGPKKKKKKKNLSFHYALSKAVL